MPYGDQLTRGARVFSAACLLALTLASAVWIVRDQATDGEAGQTWPEWPDPPAPRVELPVTSGLDWLLVVVYLVAVAAVLRRTARPGLPATLGVLTTLLHLPSLWVLGDSRLRGVDDVLLTAVLGTVLGQMALGAALVVTAVTGRNTEAGPAPARLARGQGVVAGLALLAALGGLLAAQWPEWRYLGWSRYWPLLTGEGTLVALLAPPPAWTWTVAGLSTLVAAVAALRGAGFARPLGAVTAALLLGLALSWLKVAVRLGLPERVGDLSGPELLRWAGWAVVAVAGLTVLVALTRRPRSAAAADATRASAFGPPPPSW